MIENGDEFPPDLRNGDFYPVFIQRDYKKWYYQFGIDNPDSNIVGFWSDKKKKWIFCKCSVLNMGNTLSVTHSCRVSEGVSHVLKVFFGAANTVYIDDTTIGTV